MIPESGQRIDYSRIKCLLVDRYCVDIGWKNPQGTAFLYFKMFVGTGTDVYWKITGAFL